MFKEIQEATNYIKSKISSSPEAGIIMGSGLGGLADKIEIECIIDYSDVPHFPLSTVEGHAGKLIVGKLGGKTIVAMAGRFHYYEGYTMNQVVLPIRVMKFLGIETLFLSNASGGVNPEFEIGDIMIQNDHINLFGDNPLMGPNFNDLGPRFPDMSEPYSLSLIKMAFDIGKEKGYNLQKGNYAGVSGPCLETPAEYQYVRNIGADAIGMSTVPEVIAARHMDIPCFAMSVISDLGVPGKIVEVTHEDVQAAASKSEPIMTDIITRMLEKL